MLFQYYLFCCCRTAQMPLERRCQPRGDRSLSYTWCSKLRQHPGRIVFSAPYGSRKESWRVCGHRRPRYLFCCSLRRATQTTAISLTRCRQGESRRFGECRQYASRDLGPVVHVISGVVPVALWRRFVSASYMYSC